MEAGFSKLGIGLTTLVIVFLLALAVELFWVFWWRRRFSRESSATASSMSDITLDPSSASPSKELLYFLWCKKQSRVEPAGPLSSPAPRCPGAKVTNRPESRAFSQKVNGVPAGTDAETWMGVYGPSSLLHTIKEGRESLSAAMEDLERGVAVRETTPFSTPCASPPFYTPLSSPLAEHDSSVRNPTTLLEKTACLVG